MAVVIDDRPLNTFGRRDIGALLADAFRIYGRNFLKLMALGAVLYIPIFIFSMITQFAFPWENPATSVIGTPWMIGLAAVGVIVALVLEVLLLGAMIHGLTQQEILPQIGIGAAYARARKRFLPLLGALVLKWLAISLMTITVIGIPAAIYFGVRWCFVEQAIILEGHDVEDAFTRSSKLVKQGWWDVFGPQVLWWLILAATISVVQVPIFAITFGDAMAGAYTTAPYLMSGSTMLWINLLSFVTGILLLPLEYVFQTLLFFDRRGKREEFTPVMLAEDMGMITEYREYTASEASRSGE